MRAVVDDDHESSAPATAPRAARAGGGPSTRSLAARPSRDLPAAGAPGPRHVADFLQDPHALVDGVDWDLMIRDGGVASAPSTTSTGAGTGGALLRSAATDLATLIVVASAVTGPAVPGARPSPPELAARLFVVVRRIDEAEGAIPPSQTSELENVAGAARQLLLSLAPEYTQSPEVQDATQSLMSAIAAVATAAHYSVTVEPIADARPLRDDEHGALAKRLLAEAAAELATASQAKSGVGNAAAERAIVVPAASRAGAKVRVARELVETHVAPGDSRMQFTDSAETLKRAVDQLDQWVRAAHLDSDPSVALLYRSEWELRHLAGLLPVERAAVGTIDPGRAADRLLDPDSVAVALGSFEQVAISVNALLGAVERQIDVFEMGAKATKPKQHERLFDALVDYAIDKVMLANLEVMFFKAAMDLGRRMLHADDDAGGELAEHVVELVAKHTLARLSTSDRSGDASTLLDAFVINLGAQHAKLSKDLLNNLAAERAALESIHAQSLGALVAELDARSDAVATQSLGNMVLAWQRLQAQAMLGTPGDPTTIGDVVANDAAPVHDDADVEPGPRANEQGVLRVHVPIDRADPRRAAVEPGSGVIEGLTSPHRKALSRSIAEVPRPLRALHLNVIVQVTYGASWAGAIEIVYRPDNDAIEIAWMNGDRDLRMARHLQGYARGVSTESPALDDATPADAEAGARLLAEHVMATDARVVFR